MTYVDGNDHAPKTAIQMPTFKLGLQYRITRPAAVRFVGVATIYLKK